MGLPPIMFPAGASAPGMAAAAVPAVPAFATAAATAAAFAPGGTTETGCQ